jgi:hypothetical protein
MDTSRNRAWIPAALLLGALYLLIGRLFAVPNNHVRAWRLAAWVVSGVGFAAHIGYEHFKLRHSPRLIALHTALAVAIGAIALALAGMIHSMWVASTIRPSWLLALVIWPAAAAVPAFLIALVVGALLARLRRSAYAE